MWNSAGWSVALSGDRMAVGAPMSDPSSQVVRPGLARVFLRDKEGQWIREADLGFDEATYVDGVSGRCGNAVAISGDTLALGCGDVGFGTGTGDVLIFHHSGTMWVLQQVLTPSDAKSTAEFGYSVALDEDTLVVGAPLQRTGMNSTGGAWVFRRSGGEWVEHQRLVPVLLETGDQLGISVALSGDTILVGAVNHDTDGSNAGAAWAFVEDEGVWVEQARLIPTDTGESNHFGHSVALQGEIAVVGALGHSANIFTRSGSTWTAGPQLLPDAQGFSYAHSIAIGGDRIAVGSHSDSDAGTSAGAVYLFEHDGLNWERSEKLTIPDTPGDFLGFSVAMESDRLVAGALLRYADIPNGAIDHVVGAAVIYDLSEDSAQLDADLDGLHHAVYDLMGYRVALQGDTMAMYSLLDWDNVRTEGSVRFFKKQEDATWAFTQRVFAPREGAIQPNLSENMAMSGDLLLVQAFGFGDPAFKVLALRRSGDQWESLGYLAPTGIRSFGHSIAMDGTTAIITATGLNNGEESYVFDFDGIAWTQIQRLTADDGASDDFFGYPVSISGDTIVIGASLANAPSSNSGAAYVFQKIGGTWQQVQKLIASDGAAEDRFGSCHVIGDQLFVGARQHGGSGAVYRFERNGTWQETRKYVPDDPVAGMFFGASLVSTEQLLAVGAPYGHTVGGAVYVWRHSAGDSGMPTKIIPSFTMVDSSFGSALAADGSIVLVGSPYESAPDFGSGAAYLYDVFSPSSQWVIE